MATVYGLQKWVVKDKDFRWLQKQVIFSGH